MRRKKSDLEDYLRSDKFQRAVEETVQAMSGLYAESIVQARQDNDPETCLAILDDIQRFMDEAFVQAYPEFAESPEHIAARKSVEKEFVQARRQFMGVWFPGYMQ